MDQKTKPKNKPKIYEYIVISGIGRTLKVRDIDDSDSITYAMELLFVPEILLTLPQTAKPPPVLENFLQPMCGVRLHAQPREPIYHEYLLTDVTGDKLYGFSHTFYQKFNFQTYKALRKLFKSQGRDKGIPDVLYSARTVSIVSKYPYHQTFKRILEDFMTTQQKGRIYTRKLAIDLSAFLDHIPIPKIEMISQRIIWKNKEYGCFPTIPESHKLPLADNDFKILFSCLSLENIILIWNAILKERKLLFISRSLEYLTPCIFGLLSLIYPFKWSYPLIPILPLNFIEVFQSPVPYIIGCLSSIIEISYPEEDEIIIDLDSNHIVSKEPIINLPPRIFTNLKTKLEKNCNLFKKPKKSLRISPLCNINQICTKKYENDKLYTSFSSSEEHQDSGNNQFLENNKTINNNSNSTDQESNSTFMENFKKKRKIPIFQLIKVKTIGFREKKQSKTNTNKKIVFNSSESTSDHKKKYSQASPSLKPIYTNNRSTNHIINKKIQSNRKRNKSMVHINHFERSYKGTKNTNTRKLKQTINEKNNLNFKQTRNPEMKRKAKEKQKLENRSSKRKATNIKKEKRNPQKIEKTHKEKRSHSHSHNHSHSHSHKKQEKIQQQQKKGKEKIKKENVKENEKIKKIREKRRATNLKNEKERKQQKMKEKRKQEKSVKRKKQIPKEKKEVNEKRTNNNWNIQKETKNKHEKAKKGKSKENTQRTKEKKIDQKHKSKRKEEQKIENRSSKRKTTNIKKEKRNPQKIEKTQNEKRSHNHSRSHSRSHNRSRSHSHSHKKQEKIQQQKKKGKEKLKKENVKENEKIKKIREKRRATNLKNEKERKQQKMNEKRKQEKSVKMKKQIPKEKKKIKVKEQENSRETIQNQKKQENTQKSELKENIKRRKKDHINTKMVESNLQKAKKGKNGKEEIQQIQRKKGEYDDLAFNLKAIRKVFLSVLVQMLKKFTRYLLIPENNDKMQIQSLFDDNKFLKEVPEDCIPFLTPFLKTQMFNNLIEEKIFSKNNDFKYFFKKIKSKMEKRCNYITKFQNEKFSNWGKLRFTNKGKKWKKFHFVFKDNMIYYSKKEILLNNISKKIKTIPLTKGRSKIEIPNIGDDYINNNEGGYGIKSNSSEKKIFYLNTFLKHKNNPEIFVEQRLEFKVANEKIRKQMVQIIKANCVGQEEITFLNQFITIKKIRKMNSWVSSEKRYSFKALNLNKMHLEAKEKQVHIGDIDCKIGFSTEVSSGDYHSEESSNENNRKKFKKKNN
ncbi:c-myc promoter binding protein [Anaeramoeba flamelloides]|uniref:C-myc promoter binding protein n=1 Tax=Anaeramoeba flamelloides TaxID=1746091 RepID=A0AAV8A1G9_9EUKA|nr:c-myc promoter binding protein [Anaeramoeba flamelloides]